MIVLRIALSVVGERRRLGEGLLEKIRKAFAKYKKDHPRDSPTPYKYDVFDLESEVVEMLLFPFLSKLQDLVNQLPEDLTVKHDNLELVPLCEFWGFHNKTVEIKEEFDQVLEGNKK